MKNFLTLIALCCVALQIAHTQKQVYLEEIKKAAEKGWNENPSVIAAWKKSAEPSVLWGYNPPAHPVYLAAVLGFLYEETHERLYAERAAQLLGAYGDLRSSIPNEYASSRVEYENGIPSLTNFFFLPPYVRAYISLRGSGLLDARLRSKIEGEIAESIDFIFRHPEWGAHNRAMLRAEALTYATLALPSHPHAAKWRKMAEVLASDNVRHWEIEDASNYNPVWLHALFSFASATGDSGVYSSSMMRYYMEYYTRLISPAGTLPDFGDAGWNSPSGGLRLTAVFEKGASVFHDPGMKWAAQSVYNTAKRRENVLGIDEAYHLADAFRWSDESVLPRTPTGGSQEVLDDVIGKKVVFRSGWDSSATFLLLDYRDEGDGGWLPREYLRQTISVEEEKMHHGHADENSIVLLMNKGSVLLHDGGYRDALPSGDNGAWRQDYFHNRVIARKNKRDKNQKLLAFVQNSGAYRRVQTMKIDFLSLHSVDMSRTRLVDEELGYRWDRVITWVRDPGYFIVVDGIRALRPDYFTFASLWHAQNVMERGEHYYDIATDSVPGYRFSPNQSLLVYFPETYAKTEGVEPERRHWQSEQVIYQTISGQYKAGDCELFVTLLVPHDRSVPARSFIPEFRLMPTSAPYRSVALEILRGKQKDYLFVKLDLEMEIARENIRPRYLYDLGKVSFGDFETDAHFLYAEVGADSLRYSASNVLKVMHRGRVLMQALPNTHALQLDGGPDNHVGFSKWRYWEDTSPIHPSEK
jgi:hypothetical protein